MAMYVPINRTTKKRSEPITAAEREVWETHPWTKGQFDFEEVDTEPAPEPVESKSAKKKPARKKRRKSTA